MPLYKTDPNDPKKQIADIKPGGIHRFSYAACPTAQTITKRPSYVTVNSHGVYAFLYETTASAGGVSQTESYITGSFVSASAGPIKLDINPVAWRRDGFVGDDGDVTFVYARIK